LTREKPMGFWDHLEELRGTIIKSVITFIIFAALIGYFIKEFNEVLMWPLLSVTAEYPKLVVELGTTTLLEVFNMIIQMCFLGGLTMSAPFILFYVSQFVAPALTEKELKIVLPLCISALFLFVVGAVVLVPSTVRVAIELNNVFHLAFRWTVGSYYSTLMWLVLGVGGLFEFPLVIVLLVWMGVMTTAFLRKYRRHAIVVIFVLSAIITPTPDPITQSFVAAPLYGLYEIAVFIGSRIEKSRAKAAGIL
jgi:sec-independent protein translocase protein TatC